MKKIYFLLFTFIGLVSFGQSPIITTILDGDCAGGNPKLLEIYANGTVDFTLYSLENQTNANITWGNTQDLSSLGTVTDGFVYVTTAGSADGIISDFPALASASVVESNTMNLNGDDRIRIILTSDSSVIDQYGVSDVDGSGEAWEYKDGYSTRVNGTGPDGGFVATNWNYNNGSLDGLGVCQGGTDTYQTIIGGVGVYSTTGSTTPSITITSPSNSAELAAGTTSVNVEWTTDNLMGGETVDITVDGSTTNGVTSPFPITTMDGGTYNITVELVNGGVLDSDMISFSVSEAVIQVANIAALRAGTIGTDYQLTNEVLITYLTGFRSQKHIEDATGGILIDDDSGVIPSSYALADGITGLVGTLGEFNNTLQFAPLQDPGAASSTGNTLPFQTVTLAELTANAENYESELVKVINVDLDNTETNFSNGLEIPMTQGTDMFNFRTAFNENYSDGIIPTIPADVTGVILDRSGSYFLMARYASDFSVNVLSVDQFNSSEFSLYPNPTNTGVVTISSTNSDAMNVQVFDVLGKQVKNETLTNNRLNVSNLNSGVYILKITQNNATITKKLVIR
jgi:hypothetical protein